MNPFKKLVQSLRETINAQITALNGQTGKPADDLRTSLNGQLEQCNALDKLPESEANVSFAEVMGKMQEYAKKLFEDLQGALSNLATTTKSYNELKASVDAGDLLKKEVVTERCDLAKQQGVDLCQPEIADLRKKVLAGLPAPPDNIIKLPTVEFASAVEDMRANMEVAKGKGLTLEGKGSAFLKRCLWTKKDAFATELAGIEEFIPAKSSADPLLGGDDQPAPAAATGGPRGLGMC